MQQLNDIAGSAKTSGARSRLDIEFLEVDMPTTGSAGCAACDNVAGRLDAAVEVVRPVLDVLGVEVDVRRMRVRTEDEASRFALRASPTIRVGGHEIAPEHLGTGEERVWTWRGVIFDTPPAAMLIDSLLRAYVSNLAVERQSDATPPSEEAYEVPRYLKQFLTQEGDAATSAVTSDRCGCRHGG